MIKNELVGIFDVVGVDTRLELALWFERRHFEWARIGEVLQ